ncbi:hypothetical protein [Nonomuraea sp. NPDC005650]|uniref:hypothetical protein n=1 Tax=Nonomuraea sp. NPDC005650 TaxID=3157045 RepID=UPI0033A22DE8
MRRAGVPTWLQVVFSSVVMGVYHGVLGAHDSVQYAISSAVLFGLVSVIFVVGRRSLPPGLVAHMMRPGRSAPCCRPIRPRPHQSG